MPIPQQVVSDNESVQRLVMAAERLMYDPKSRGVFMQGITAKASLPMVLAKETVGILKMIDDRTRGNVPKQLIPPAAVLILGEIARFMKDAGLAEPTEQDVADGIKKMLTMLLMTFGQDMKQRAAQGAQPGQPMPPQAPPQAQQGGLIAAGV